jgi:hypothetical protein
VTRGDFPVAYFSVKYSDVFCGKDLCVYSDNWYVRHKKEPVTSEMQEKLFLEPKENQKIVFSSNMTLLSLWALHGKLIVLKVRSAKSFSPIIIQCPCLFLSQVKILTTGDYARRRKYDSVTHSLYLAFLLTLFHPGPSHLSTKNEHNQCNHIIISMLIFMSIILSVQLCKYDEILSDSLLCYAK